MEKETQEKVLKELTQAIEELSTAKRMLENGSRTVITQSLTNEIYNWIGTGTMAATAAKNELFNETTYKEQCDEIQSRTS
ncbi:hypothetical protein F4Z99_17460 [Candidatus Poribacteria bacterium]|nr:hypothetical protein [Candidatus Poribacteria bacterium]